MPRLPAFCLAAVAALPGLAAAQTQQCGERGRIVGILAEKYGETPRSIGLTPQGALVETYASDDTRSWTITVSFPDGRMCLLASGTSFEALQPGLIPSGAPA